MFKSIHNINTVNIHTLNINTKHKHTLTSPYLCQLQVVSIELFWFYFVSFSDNGVCFLRFIYSPPNKMWLSIPIGTFLTNYDVTNRKLQPIETYSIERKQTKWERKSPMETTLQALLQNISCLSFQMFDIYVFMSIHTHVPAPMFKCCNIVKPFFFHLFVH